MKKQHLAALAATLFIQLPAQAQLSDNTVRIGVMTDLSGVYLDYAGKGSVEAARMAIEDFTRANPGMKVELLTADHQNKADIGSAKAREWFDRDGVDAVVDLPNSSVALSVARMAADKKRIALITGGANLRHTNEECTPYLVHYVYDTYSLANVAGKALVKQGLKDWYFLTADYAFGVSLEKSTIDVVKDAGGKVAGAIRHPLNTSDFSSFLLQAQASKAQVVALANGGGDTINAIKAANDFSVAGKQNLVALLMTISDVHSLGLAQTQRMKLADAWYWDLDADSRAFGRRFFSRMQRMPNMIHAGTYSAVSHYLKAIASTKTDEPDKVMTAMKSTKINDMFSKNGYIREDGRMMHDMYLMEVKSPSESKAPWDYLKRVATVPADEAFQPLSASRCPLLRK